MRLNNLSPAGRVLLALAVGGAVFGIATAVQASIPDANGVIHGCYNHSLAHGSPLGDLRVIDASAVNGNCASWETPLNWNQTGVTGPTGPTGPAGVPGLAISPFNFVVSGPGGGFVNVSLTCPDTSKIAVGGYIYDSTNTANIAPRGFGNTGTLAGGAANNSWTFAFSLVATTGGDNGQLQIVCVNPPVGSAAPSSHSVSKPSIKVLSASPGVNIVSR